MNVFFSNSEAKARISNIGECQHALELLSENERETYFKDMFECSKVMLGEYKALLSDMNENANKMYCENCSQDEKKEAITNFAVAVLAEVAECAKQEDAPLYEGDKEVDSFVRLSDVENAINKYLDELVN